MAQPKRIHSITTERLYDDSPDLSYLGEYSDREDGDYSIDRKHAIDCAVNNGDSARRLEQLQARLARIDAERFNYKGEDDERCVKLERIGDKISDLIEILEDDGGCTCGDAGNWERGEYRYFNPTRNYEGETPEDIRKYVAQDYARYEAYNDSEWACIGIRATAEIEVGGTIQTVQSGGLWGTESDSEESYLRSIEDEQLGELRPLLAELGFGKRAIATAMQNVERKDLQ